MTTISTASISASPPAAQSQNAELRKAAQAFEAVFLRQMIGSMRAASFGDDIFGSQATEQFREMSDARLADSMAEKGALGIADMLISQLGTRLNSTPTKTAIDTPKGVPNE